MEIQLLRNLDHMNIVKYIDAIRTDDNLNIVIEYVENGALSGLLSKLHQSNVEEGLVAVYTKQILLGLKYLHDQGVIHRDIKGANILSTKEGIVKLADFGVATKLNESRKSDSVVGTPYWMAPEIIEMTGQQSSACDIWSVGCTVVELLTGKPPYFDLQQMPALFRIVQDSHPPLPDNISDALEDFLMQCFQKDPLRRISADGLLKHTWLKQVELPTAETPVNITSYYGSGLVERKDGSVGPATAADAPPPQLPVSLSSAALRGSEEDRVVPRQRVASMAYSGVITGVQPAAFEMRHAAGKAAVPVGIEIEEDEVWDEDELDGLDDFDTDELASRRQQTNWDTIDPNASDEEVDVFADLELEVDPKTDEDAQVSKAFMKSIAQLTPKEEEATIFKSCQKLADLFAKHPEIVRNMMTTRGVIPVMEMLEVPNPTVIVEILKLVNLIIGQGDRFQSNMTDVGLIPAIIKFASPGFPSSIRHEAAKFVRYFCYASDATRKMFIACGGLPPLVGFLEEPYPEGRALIFNAIDCIRHVFELSTNPKNDFCRLFCKYGLPTPMTRCFAAIDSDSSHPDAKEYTTKIAELILLFSNGDAFVKQAFVKPRVLSHLLRVLMKLGHNDQKHIIKAIKNFSMDPSTLDMLEDANAIPALIPFLNSQHVEVQHQVLIAMYYLCTIKGSRQEQAARHGIIPHLQRFIRANHPLKQFALPVIFQLAQTSKRTRLELKKHNGIAFFLDMLAEPYWRTHALDAISYWLAEDPRRVEFMLLTSTNINKLVAVLKYTKTTVQFEKILGPFLRIMQSSRAVNQSLGRSAAFIREICQRLVDHGSNNNIRISLLKILSCVHDQHKSPRQLVTTHNLVPLLATVASDRQAVMVSQLARRLLQQIQDAGSANISPDHKE
jgi:Protein kinase domain